MLFFFFKQKTAYEMRISDWSSDVCSSDLLAGEDIGPGQRDRDGEQRRAHAGDQAVPEIAMELVDDEHVAPRLEADLARNPGRLVEIGRASCRERVCQYV